MAGVTVTFEVTAGAGTIERTTAVTAADGRASPGTWLLGPRPGANTLEARVTGVTPAVFSVTAAAGPPATLTASGSGTARGVVGQLLDPTPAVLVQDALGNPVSGVAVTFTPGPEAGQVAQPSVVTDAGGLARPVWTLGTAAGTQTVRAVVGTLSVTLTAEVSAAAPAGVVALAGSDQSAAVGQPVAVAPAVQVKDAYGNSVAGATVLFTVTEGAGQVTGGSALTDAAGTARVGAWTLGTRTGTNRLLASVTGAQPVSFSAVALPGPAAALAKLAGDGQTGTAGQPLPIAPAVTVSDGYGNPVPNVAVTFSAAGGAVVGGTALSDAAGTARADRWQLGSTVGTQTLEARAGALLVTFTATATPGQPAVLQVAAGQDQSAPAGTTVPVRPAVRVLDAGGNLLSGVTVRFAVTAGGGIVSGATALTGSDGIATSGSWTLGIVAGPNRLTASVTGAGSVAFNATGTTGVPARIVKAAGDGQTVASGSTVTIPPTVRVTDLNGNAVKDVTVTFQPSAGSTVTGGTQKTATDGTASVGSWRLADVGGTNTLVASVAGVGNVTFTATGLDFAPPPAPFQIQLRFLTAVTATQQQAFQAAAGRWETIIASDLPDGRLTVPAGSCGTGTPAVDEVIDDLVVFVQLEAIDGAGSVLGSAGPCYVRGNGHLPLLGSMRFDTADLDALEQSGRLGDVILHELGHVLGIGTIWSSFSLLQGAGTADPYFSGPAARQGFVLAGGASPAGYGVPVENTGGSSTRDSHWRESTLRTELMTGWISGAGTPNPLSAITVASLADLGYGVNLGAADPFTVPAVSGYQLDVPVIELVEERLPPPRIAH